MSCQYNSQIIIKNMKKNDKNKIKIILNRKY